MRNSDKIIRYSAFYFSLALYLILLPIILAYSFGYHIDFHKFIIYKTGILALKSTPSAASIYINGKIYKDSTPARVEELRPGTYLVEVKQEGFYPWQKELAVKPNMVTRAENIILFPTLQDMEKIGEYEADNFVIPDNKNQIYYMTPKGLYGSGIDGANPKKLSSYSDWPANIINKKFSPDGKKFLYYTEYGIWVVYLNSNNLAKGGESAKVKEILRTSLAIRDCFWHSGSHHIVFVSGREINVLDLGGDAEKNIVTLHKCGRAPEGLSYDNTNDSLYFNDTSKGRPYLFRIDLREKFFDKFMQRVKKEFDIIYEKR